MDLKGIMQSELCQTEKGKYNVISLYVEFKKHPQNNQQTKQKKTHKAENRLVVVIGKGHGGMDEIGQGEKGKTSKYKISKSQGLKYSVGNIINNVVTTYGDKW